jgi:hypothetical protein
MSENQKPATSRLSDRFRLEMSTSLNELRSALRAAFVHPESAWKKMEAFHSKHGLSALLSEITAERRVRFGRAPGGLSSGDYFTAKGEEIRTQAKAAREALPELVKAYYDSRAVASPGHVPLTVNRANASSRVS